MKFSFKSVKKFLWEYKYVITLLLVLFIIYYYMNVYIQENLENNVSRDDKNFVLQVENTNDFDFNIQVYKLSYDPTSKKNSYKDIEIVKSTSSSKKEVTGTLGSILIPSKKTVILPAGNDKFSSGFDAKLYLDGGNLGFGIKVSTTDNSAKKIAYKLTYCNKVKAGGKTLCYINAPLIGKFKELTDLQFRDSRDNATITISDASKSSTKIYQINPIKDISSYSIGFIYLPSKTST